MGTECGWRERWSQDTFYLHEHPAEHFDTLVHHSDILARGLTTWLGTLQLSNLEIFDLGAGNGALAVAMRTLLPVNSSVHAIDLRPPPHPLPPGIDWHTLDVTKCDLPRRDLDATPVIIAHELLDDIPCDVVIVDDDATYRWVNFEADGFPALGDHVDDPGVIDWIQRWWPGLRPGMQIEVGISRDLLWQQLMHQWPHTIGILIDYGHTLRERAIGTWDGGTMAGYRSGRLVSPQLDGRTNITAHVAVDAIAAVTPYSVITRLESFLNSSQDLQSTGSLGDYHVVMSHMKDVS